MALTRKFLNSLKLDEAAIESIIEAHSETVEALKKQRDDAQAEASTASEVIKERDQLKQRVEALEKQGGDAAKVQTEFDAYKQQVEAEKARGRKMTAFDALLKDAGVARDSFRSTICKTVDLDKIELDDQGAIKDADAHKERIKTDYADFIGTTNMEGAPKLDPPGGAPKTYTRAQIQKMSADEINKNWDSIKGSLANLE